MTNVQFGLTYSVLNNNKSNTLQENRQKAADVTKTFTHSLDQAGVAYKVEQAPHSATHFIYTGLELKELTKVAKKEAALEAEARKNGESKQFNKLREDCMQSNRRIYDHQIKIDLNA